MLEFQALPVIESLEPEEQEKYNKAQEELPNLTQLKRGMRVKILGDHLKILPEDDHEEGFFFIGCEQKHELTDFLQVNPNSVLLLNLPTDFPCGHYSIFISSGWYDDPAIHRTGVYRCGGGVIHTTPRMPHLDRLGVTSVVIRQAMTNKSISI